MPGEGRWGEGGEGDARREEGDPFEDYGEELEQKYGDNAEPEERSEGAEPSKEDVSAGQDDFEAYAKELETKYREGDVSDDQAQGGEEKQDSEGKEAAPEQQDARDEEQRDGDEQGGEPEAKGAQPQEAEPQAESRDAPNAADEQTEPSDSDSQVDPPREKRTPGDEDEARDSTSPEAKEPHAEPEASAQDAQGIANQLTEAGDASKGDRLDGRQPLGDENDIRGLAPPEAELRELEGGASQSESSHEQLESQKEPPVERQEESAEVPERSDDSADVPNQTTIPGPDAPEQIAEVRPDGMERPEAPYVAEAPVAAPQQAQPESQLGDIWEGPQQVLQMAEPRQEPPEADSVNDPKAPELTAANGGRLEPSDVIPRENLNAPETVSGEGTVAQFAPLQDSGGAAPEKETVPNAQAESVAPVTARELDEQPLAVIEAKAYEYQIPGREPSVRFDIRSESLQRETGVEMEDGKVYEIRGRIGDIDFSKTHLEKEGNHVIIMVPKEHRDEVQSGRHYEIKIDSIEERRTFRAESNGERAALNFQPRTLESFGLPPREVKEEGQRILEFQIHNLSKPGESPVTAYTQTMPHDGGARLAVTKLGAKGGDEFEVLGVRERTLPDFVKEFNAAQKPEELRNVQLELAKDRLSLDVDGHKFPFTDHSLSTRNLEIVLRTHLELSKREVRFWYDGQTYKPRLDECKIMGFKASDHGLKMVYEASQHRISTISSELYVDQVPRHPVENLSVKEISSKLRMLDKPEGPLGDYRFETDSSLHERIASKLQGLKGDAYNKARGTIGENLAPAIMSPNGWKEITRHPLDASENRIGCSKRGPDSLMHFVPENRYYLLETKWRKDVEKAATEARVQVSSDYVLKHAPKLVSGGLIGIIDWELGKQHGNLHVEQVWRRDQA